jgi:hypothetical protein
MDKTDHEQRFRDHAEECRVLATIVPDQTARHGYLKLARAYMVLASEEEAGTQMRKAVVRTPALSSNLPRHRSVMRAACRALIIQR